MEHKVTSIIRIMLQHWILSIAMFFILFFVLAVVAFYRLTDISGDLAAHRELLLSKGVELDPGKVLGQFAHLDDDFINRYTALQEQSSGIFPLGSNEDFMGIFGERDDTPGEFYGQSFLSSHREAEYNSFNEDILAYYKEIDPDLRQRRKQLIEDLIRFGQSSNNYITRSDFRLENNTISIWMKLYHCADELDSFEPMGDGKYYTLELLEIYPVDGIFFHQMYMSEMSTSIQVMHEELSNENVDYFIEKIDTYEQQLLSRLKIAMSLSRLENYLMLEEHGMVYVDVIKGPFAKRWDIPQILKDVDLRLSVKLNTQRWLSDTELYIEEILDGITEDQFKINLLSDFLMREEPELSALESFVGISGYLPVLQTMIDNTIKLKLHLAYAKSIFSETDLPNDPFIDTPTPLREIKDISGKVVGHYSVGPNQIDDGWRNEKFTRPMWLNGKKPEDLN